MVTANKVKKTMLKLFRIRTRLGFEPQKSPGVRKVKSMLKERLVRREYQQQILGRLRAYSCYRLQRGEFGNEISPCR